MGKTWEWDKLVDQDAQELRRQYLRERVQVSRKTVWREVPHLIQVSRRSAVDRQWFRELGLKRQFVVRGVAASRDSRKAVLLGEFAAAQWGMWFATPKDHDVQFALPSGHLPPKSSLPVSTKFKAFKTPPADTAELDGVRVTHPLRTYVDYCRMQKVVNARLAIGWLLRHGFTADKISDYADNFEGSMHPRRRRLAAVLPYQVPQLETYPYMLAHSLLDDSRVKLRTHCELDRLGFATLLAGNDLVILIDEDPYWRALESEPDGLMLAHNRRKRERWEAARGFRKMYFTTAEIERAPKSFVNEVLGAMYLRDRGLVY